jgi:fatty-acyl-CoA synthase
MNLLGRIRRDYIQVRAILRALGVLRFVRAHPSHTFADIVEGWAAKTPDAPAIFFESRLYSYRDYDQAGNQYARWAQTQSIKRGESVALMMENWPEYLFAMLGLAKMGAVASLINVNLRGAALAHSLAVTGAKHVILGAELAETWAEAAALITEKPQVWTTGGVIANTHDLDVELSCQSPEPLFGNPRTGLTIDDLCLQVFTSGTTGMPKAANLSHRRCLGIALTFSALANATKHDRVYVVLPLYHTSGVVAAVGMTLTKGGAVILRRRFSVQHFWEDCARYEATLFQYIGELCRYLVNAPPHPKERAHKIRCVVGNGLRPDIWQKFQDRFAIPQIVEFYGSTEGNVSLFNADGKVGAVGRIPPYFAGLFNVKIVKFDVESGTHLRGPDGFCIECAPGEAGEILGRIEENPSQATIGRFEGYSDKKATESKILRGVFAPGDAWFHTGDLLKRDAEGYFYFVDRIGDTFRWKGENVATSEVAQVVASFPGVREANIYGIHIPGTEGRAGMAAITVEPTVDLLGLHSYLEKNLPAYARPLFLRVQGAIDTTGTFKQKKGDLVAEGFDPAQIADMLYFDHPKRHGYVPLDPALYQEISSGQLRL